MAAPPSHDPQRTARLAAVWGVALPLLTIGLILTADAFEGPKTAFIGVLVMVPMLSAVFATPLITALVAVITWLAALVFGLLSHDGTAPAQFVRLAIIAAVGVAAVIAATQRVRFQRQLGAVQLQAAQAEAARRDAITDWLTGLLNRRGLEAEYEQRGNEAGSVILFDLNRMKQVNDEFGHSVGDDVLRAVAGRIRGRTAHQDAVGRWGGDEFLVITNALGGRAEAIAARIAGGVAANPVRSGNLTLPMSVSFGVAEFAIGDAMRDVLRMADDRMYASKRGDESPRESA